jgi:hypothetical protein
MVHYTELFDDTEEMKSFETDKETTTTFSLPEVYASDPSSNLEEPQSTIPFLRQDIMIGGRTVRRSKTRKHRH